MRLPSLFAAKHGVRFCLKGWKPGCLSLESALVGIFGKKIRHEAKKKAKYKSERTRWSNQSAGHPEPAAIFSSLRAFSPRLDGQSWRRFLENVAEAPKAVRSFLHNTPQNRI